MCESENPHDFDDVNPDEDQDLIIETLPILKKIHARLASGLSRDDKSTAINEQVKTIFDGAIYAHDQARTQDWKNLENQLEQLASDAIRTLIFLRRRHYRAGSTDAQET